MNTIGTTGIPDPVFVCGRAEERTRPLVLAMI